MLVSASQGRQILKGNGHRHSLAGQEISRWGDSVEGFLVVVVVDEEISWGNTIKGGNFCVVWAEAFEYTWKIENGVVGLTVVSVLVRVVGSVVVVVFVVGKVWVVGIEIVVGTVVVGCFVVVVVVVVVGVVVVVVIVVVVVFGVVVVARVVVKCPCTG